MLTSIQLIKVALLKKSSGVFIDSYISSLLFDNK